jgi:hypothetical protein
MNQERTMTKKLSRWLLAAVAVLPPAAASAQERTEKTLTPLKVQVVFARYQGEKKVSSLPYTLLVTDDHRRVTTVRMGVQVPIQVQTEKGMTTSYRDVGTNVDCGAENLGEGRYKLNFGLEQMSVSSGEARAAASSGAAPVIHGFRSNTTMILRDGQSGQYTATDPVNGETLRIDVTLNVLK